MYGNQSDISDTDVDVLYLVPWSYIILRKVAHVADDPNPDEHGACAEEDAANVIACEDLQEIVDESKI